ncbi:hypothetical protein QYF61_014980, partial [Mycteria americana]
MNLIFSYSGRDFALPVPVLRSIYLRELEVCFPKIQGPDFTLHLTHIPQDCELHQCMITAAQIASNLDVSDSLTCVGDQQHLRTFEDQNNVRGHSENRVCWGLGYHVLAPQKFHGVAYIIV